VSLLVSFLCWKSYLLPGIAHQFAVLHSAHQAVPFFSDLTSLILVFHVRTPRSHSKRPKSSPLGLFRWKSLLCLLHDHVIEIDDPPSSIATLRTTTYSAFLQQNPFSAFGTRTPFPYVTTSLSAGFIRSLTVGVQGHKPFCVPPGCEKKFCRPTTLGCLMLSIAAIRRATDTGARLFGRFFMPDTVFTSTAPPFLFLMSSCQCPSFTSPYTPFAGRGPPTAFTRQFPANTRCISLVFRSLLPLRSSTLISPSRQAARQKKALERSLWFSPLASTGSVTSGRHVSLSSPYILPVSRSLNMDTFHFISSF